MAPAPTSQHYNWHIRALTVPGPDTDLSVFVAFDNVRYLFGCGEGTQRAFVQKRLSTRGLAGVFLPDGGNKGRGGLPGMIMTACDAGIRKLDIVGPQDTAQNLATLRGSVYRKEMNIAAHAYSTENGAPGNVYAGSNLTVRSIALQPSLPASEASPSSPAGASGYKKRRYAAELTGRHVGAMFSEGGPSNRPDFFGFQPVPLPEETATQMIYVCQAPDVPGKFDNAKATALKVPFGPIRGKLVRGEAIEVDDPVNPGQKRVVKPEDVIGGGSEGAVMITVNCSEATLPSLLKTTELDRYRSHTPSAERKQVSAIVHRVPKAVLQDQAFQEWTETFGPTTQHLVALTDDYRHDATFTSSAKNVLQLSMLDEDIFPLLHAATPDTWTAPALPPNATLLQSGHQLKMQPKGQLEMLSHDRDVPYPSTPDGVEAARQGFAKDMPEYAAECAKAREAVRADPRWSVSSRDPGSDIVVTTLGTGSAIPSKYRNVSSTHLDVPGLGGILLDCGEGTLGQLRRRYGYDGLRKVYQELRMVFVSHMHADHHLGLQSILQDRFANGITSKLYLVAPIHIAISLSEAGPWSCGVPQEALDNLIWVDNASLQKGPLPGVESSASDDEAAPTRPTSPPPESEQQPMDADVPVSSRFTEGLRRWPRTDAFSKLYKQKHSADAAADLMRDLSFTGVRVPKVAHRGHAWGLVLHHSTGWKIVYSGDTKPCRSLVKAGKGATLLIHEATLEDDKPDVAHDKGHSTFSQAIEVGQKMGARYIMLNHFSQRYPKLPKSRQKQGGADDAVVSISYDFMSVRVDQMWRMGYYLDAAELLFKEAEEEDGEGNEGDEEAVKSAVEGDRNATLDGGKKGAAGGGKAGKGGKGAKGRAEKVQGQGMANGKKTGAKGEKRAASPVQAGNQGSEPKRPRSEEGAA